MAENALIDETAARDLDARIELQKKVVRRRELFAAAFTDELLNELEEFMGVKDAIFAFVPDKDGKMDALDACRVDTLMGVVRGLRFEVAHKAEAEAYLKGLLEQRGEEVSHE